MTVSAREWMLHRLTLILLTGMTGVLVLALTYAPTWLLILAGWCWLSLTVGLVVGWGFRCLEANEERFRDLEDAEVASLDAIWEMS